MNLKFAGLMVLFVIAMGGVTWATEPWEVDANTLALYHCEDTSGTVVDDATGNYDGVANVTALLGSSVHKVGDYSIYPNKVNYFQNITLLSTFPGNGTVELWFNPDVSISTSHANMRLFTKAGTLGSLDLWFETNSNQLGFNNVYSSANHLVYSTGRTWNAEQWYHVAVMWGTGGMKMYIDGVLEDENTDEGKPGNAGYPFTVGCYSYDTTTGYCFDGKIDEIRVSNIQRDCTITSPTTTTTTSTTTTSTTTSTTTTSTTTSTTTTSTTTSTTTTSTTTSTTTTTTVPGTTTTTLAPGEAVTNNSYLILILIIIGLFLAIVLI